MNYDILYTFVLATAAMAIAPGPDNIYVFSQSISHGKKYGLATTAGLLSGCLVHTTLLAFGVSAALKANEHVFFGIKVFGAMYLFYLAFQVLRSENTTGLPTEKTAKGSLISLFKQGFIMNVLNPKVTIFFLAFFPGFLFSDSWSTIAQFYTLGFLFIGVSFFIFGGIAVLSGTIAARFSENQAVGNYLKWFQIIVFVSIGLFLILSDK
ncbi:LysE family translocator [Arenibacter sp. GZD96]|uniref:LysE family translocator n=1 Tax=Aurantibrevibacter litoralis TaxID=3106030 RepID=UPI002B002B5E|nr:LysE family translocator [Arenibacter sp. GZD-96]MEA1787085.1 LysE family translocator [Arenibacter sp. GZD-96]